MKQILLTLFFLCDITVMSAQNISRDQASADIDTLMHTLNEVHPNLYSQIAEQSLNSQIADPEGNLIEISSFKE